MLKDGSQVIASHAHIVEGVINIGEKVTKAYDPVDKLQQGAKIKEKGTPNLGIADKVLDKIKTLPSAERAANVFETTYKTLGSKAVKRTAKIGSVMVSLVINPTPVGLGLAAFFISRCL
ncbi:hypothetical protein A1C_04340 [Rickettsia akari str. Hartford]|uniref:Uncharacterized protein n=1 Tax=Rickettsia akari (strain Hartford) TaxID=293614 RepID=A8GP15_RICAH|nr:hypothetical protein [Rickettsia akari]ABV75140.1 hypothetical protein A1C_04340 [Rickettsia akari str. Hartford]